MPLLRLDDASLSLGGPPVLDGVRLLVERGERICLLGRNGEGKTTLLRLLAGEIAPDAGVVARAPGLRIGVLPQEVPAELSGRVVDVVRRELAATAADPDPEVAARRALSRLDLDAEAEVDELSSGQRRRVLLARAVAGDPDLLLLDEPTNHMDITAIGWLEAFLGRFGGAAIFVTHDRAFLRALAGRILELDRGRLFDWDCDYDTFLRRRDDRLRDEARRQAEFDRKLAQEEIWIRQGVRERRKRNEGRVRRLLAMREERRARRETSADAELAVQEAARSGRLVLQAEGLGVSRGGRPVIRDLDLRVLRGDKIGIVGANGTGKTTLLRLLLGELAPDRGGLRHGANLQVAYFDQLREQLDPRRSVQDNVNAGNPTVHVDGRPVHVITYLQRFLFTPEQARTPVALLSGGERNRLLLARLFTQPANLLALDEPTNDLDLETLELLEELLAEFAGTVLLVSHDRALLDNVVTSLLVHEGEGRFREHVGGYSDWQRERRAAGAAAPGPKARPKTRGPRSPRSRPGRSVKLSYRQSRELAALPDHIQALEARLTGLQQQLADPRLYKEAGDQVAGIRAEIAALEDELASAYQRWEELETLAEASDKTS